MEIGGNRPRPGRRSSCPTGGAAQRLVVGIWSQPDEEGRSRIDTDGSGQSHDLPGVAPEVHAVEKGAVAFEQRRPPLGPWREGSFGEDTDEDCP
jgi:hypothetical protein